tara:strand:+ start:1093 stop:1407 length:315 start_codon:yes stop_codon:yes gene_type:complete
MTIHSNLLGTGVAGNILVSAGNGVAVTTMYFANTDTNPITFNLHAVPVGFTANGNNIVYSNKLLSASDTYVIDWEKLVLDPGETLQANANVANKIVATVSTVGL